MISRAEHFYIEAFWQLHTCRSIGMSLSPIPWHSILFFADFYELPSSLFEHFVSILRGLDKAYMTWHDQELNKDRAGKRG